MGVECWYETFPNVSVQKKKSLHWTAECGRKWEEVGYIVTTFWEDTITVTLTIMYRPVPQNPDNIDTLQVSADAEETGESKEWIITLIITFRSG